MEDFKTKNETLYSVLIDGQPVIPQEIEFFKRNAPEYIKLSDEIDDRIADLVNRCPDIPKSSKVATINELHMIVIDMLQETEHFHFVFGYKFGAKMMMEIMNS